LAPEAKVGDSVAVDGCCLTVVGASGALLAFDVVPESLRRTTLGRRSAGHAVNLELPLRPSDRLGGHFVQGHVDAVAEVVARRAVGDDVVMSFRLPAALEGHVVEKGSVAIDGVSLTVAAVEGGTFSVALIPHTLAVTTLGRRAPGDFVNLEGDVLAKYVAALVRPR
jgi:riboflavin synthase